MAERAFEGLKLRNGLLRELDDVRLFGVTAGGQLLQGEELATTWVFCAGGVLWVEPFGSGRYLLQAGMYAAVPGKVGVWPEDPHDLSSAGIVVCLSGWRGMFSLGGPVEACGRLGMLLVDAHVTPELIEKAACWSDVEAWVWVDTSPGGRWPSVVKVAGRAALRFPWRREFLAGFDD